MPRPRRRQPDPARFPPCARCGQRYPGGADGWPEGRVCKYCYLQARLRTGTCAGCGALTSLPGLNPTGQPTCTRCSGIPARFRCGCGREVTAGERGRCWWCVLAGLVTDVLAGPGGQVPARLRPLAEGLVSMRRPQSGVVWLRRSTATRETLRDLARGRIPYSHAALDAAGADRAVEYLRSLLVRYGVLPPRDRRLADFQRWSAAKLDGIGNAGHRQLLERFLRWRLLRHLRSGSTTAAPLGHGPYQRAKQRLTVAIAFLAWLADRGRHLGECTQHDIDAWFGTGPTTRRHVITFLSWARQQRIIRDVDVPVTSTGGAEARPVGPDARLAAIRRLLLDQTLPPGDRIAGCLVALYGQQVSKIAALRTAEVSCAAGATRLKLGADWLDVPEPVATLLRQHLGNRTNMTTAANPASSWLFPGQLGGDHRSYRRLVRVLHQLGIPERRAVWPPGASSSATHHPQSSPTRWASHRAQRCATRSSAAPTGPPTPLAGVLAPRTSAVMGTCLLAVTRNCLETANPVAERDYPQSYGDSRSALRASAPAMSVRRERTLDWLSGAAACATSHWCSVHWRAPRLDPDQVQARPLLSRRMAASGGACRGCPAGGPQPVQQDGGGSRD